MIIIHEKWFLLPFLEIRLIKIPNVKFPISNEILKCPKRELFEHLTFHWELEIGYWTLTNFFVASITGE